MLMFGKKGALTFLPATACAEISSEFNQVFLIHYMKKGIFMTRVMDHEGV